MPFEETQKFPNWAIWLMRGIAVSVVVAFSVIYLIVETNTVVSLILLVSCIVTVLPCLLLEFMQLKTKVDGEGIRVALKPLSQKHYAWTDIVSAEMIDYGFVGGWGIRLGTKYGTVYNAQGS